MQRERAKQPSPAALQTTTCRKKRVQPQIAGDAESKIGRPKASRRVKHGRRLVVGPCAAVSHTRRTDVSAIHGLLPFCSNSGPRRRYRKPPAPLQRNPTMQKTRASGLNVAGARLQVRQVAQADSFAVPSAARRHLIDCHNNRAAIAAQQHRMIRRYIDLDWTRAGGQLCMGPSQESWRFPARRDPTWSDG